MFGLIVEEVFPFMKGLGGDGESAFALHMKDARFTFRLRKPGCWLKWSI